MRVATHCTCESHKLSRVNKKSPDLRFWKSDAKVDKKNDPKKFGAES